MKRGRTPVKQKTEFLRRFLNLIVMDQYAVPSMKGIYRMVLPVAFGFLLSIPKRAGAQDVTSIVGTESSGVDREWFLYGSLISLAAAFVFLMLFLCVWFCPCFQSSVQTDETGLRQGTGNEPRRRMYPGAEETEGSKSTYELAKIESQNSRNDSNGDKIHPDSPFLIKLKKLSDSSEQITSSDKTIIESEIHETIRHLSESTEPVDDVTSNGNCEVGM
ncbi:uncharacterized protein LOC117110028 [Anneissia japonica]|uniref:uncharacterized protein LOC117110028 n=1 Tax=Anneissia japonica TaxID=1529436 RepID=UPI0014258FF4|nr:uncharacterized protein LOC117110028 [Anneissia japonica]XP_033108476.1 uncharacterized protein LOC117110028 [Anneissia japonica]XP_033108477.1 uncharacterized protein LOC117110028 [Anneissia japonica]XP_033108479.1 uncharacterized protein LOC117110028 [Anneissia japonica]